MTILLLFFLTTIAAYLTRLYMKKYYNFWDDRGAKWNIKPYPVLGSMTATVFQTKPIHEAIDDVYKQYSQASCVGIHQLTQPALLIRDVTLVKDITVKEFDSFTDRRVVFTEEFEPILGMKIEKKTAVFEIKTGTSMLFHIEGKTLMFHMEKKHQCLILGKNIYGNIENYYPCIKNINRCFTLMLTATNL